jgi:hypothetical protein
MKLLRRLALEVIRMVDEGEFEDLTSTELELISTIIHRPLTMGREDAAKYLGVSLNRFHELKDMGIIAEPRKIKGFKEKAYYVSDLNKALQTKGFRR